MSRTDKTRPYEVAYNDPANRRFRMVGSTDYSGKQESREGAWKPLTSCHDSNCCYKYMNRYDNKQKRLAVKQDIRKGQYE